MNCSTCEAHFSDAYESALTPSRRREFERHLDGCTECRRGFAELRSVLARLRDVAPPSPPPDLADRICETLAADRAEAAPVRVPSARRWRPWAGIAALVLVTISAFLIGRSLLRAERDAWRSRATASESDVTRLGESVRQLEGEIERSRREREAMFARLEQRNRTEGDSADAARARADELARELEATTAQIEALTALVAEMRSRHREVESESYRLRTELAEARRAADATAANEAPAVGEQTDADESVLIARADHREQTEWTASDRTPAARLPRTRVVRRGSTVELQVAGSESDYVPELLRLAREGDDPELVDAALVTLEESLLVEAPTARRGRVRPQHPDLASWFGRQIGRDATPVAATPLTREVRLERCLAAWELKQRR